MTIRPELPRDASWIDSLTDEQCAEVFWLYLEQPDEFLNAHPAPLLGAAMRYALHAVSGMQGAATDVVTRGDSSRHPA